jgi:hypothetical protein
MDLERRKLAMRLKPSVCFIALILVFLGTSVWADQIILKDGTAYSGKFIRGDSKLVDFRILGKIESFRVSDIFRIEFKEPEMESSANVSPATTAPPPVRPAPPVVTERQRTQTLNREPITQTINREPVYQTAPGSSVTVPAGMGMTVRTTTMIDTDRNRVGDAFDAVLDEDLVSGTQTVAPRGTVVHGRIAYAKESSGLSGQAQLILELTDMVLNGKKYPVRTSDYTEVGASRTNKTAATVGGTAALGAIIGAIAGGGKGAAIGAASGAAVGTGVQVVTKGKVLRIPAETVLEFKLQSSLTVDAP